MQRPSLPLLHSLPRATWTGCGKGGELVGGLDCVGWNPPTTLLSTPPWADILRVQDPPCVELNRKKIQDFPLYVASHCSSNTFNKNRKSVMACDAGSCACGWSCILVKVKTTGNTQIILERKTFPNEVQWLILSYQEAKSTTNNRSTESRSSWWLQSTTCATDDSYQRPSTSLSRQKYLDPLTSPGFP